MIVVGVAVIPGMETLRGGPSHRSAASFDDYRTFPGGARPQRRPSSHADDGLGQLLVAAGEDVVGARDRLARHAGAVALTRQALELGALAPAHELVLARLDDRERHRHRADAQPRLGVRRPRAAREPPGAVGPHLAVDRAVAEPARPPHHEDAVALGRLVVGGEAQVGLVGHLGVGRLGVVEVPAQPQRRRQRGRVGEGADADHVGRAAEGLVVGDHRGAEAEAEHHDALEAPAAQYRQGGVEVERGAVHEAAAEDDAVVGHARVDRHHGEAGVGEAERDPPGHAGDVVADRAVHDQHGQAAPDRGPARAEDHAVPALAVVGAGHHQVDPERPVVGAEQRPPRPAALHDPRHVRPAAAARR